MNALQGLSGIPGSGSLPRRDLAEAATKTAVPTDMQPATGQQALGVSTQVVSGLERAAETELKRQRESEQERPADSEEVKGAVDEINEFLHSTQRTLEFTLDKEGEDMVIKIKDGEGEVVKQIPTERALELARRLREVEGLLEGILVDAQA